MLPRHLTGALPPLACARSPEPRSCPSHPERGARVPWGAQRAGPAEERTPSWPGCVSFVPEELRHVVMCRERC